MKIKIKCSCGKEKEIGKYYYENYYVKTSKIFVCGTCRCLGENNSFYGKKHNQEFKERISLERKIKYLGKNNPFYGKTHSKKTKKIISKKNKEWLKIHDNAFLGHKHSEKSKNQMSKSQKEYYEKHPEAKERNRKIY